MPTLSARVAAPPERPDAILSADQIVTGYSGVPVVHGVSVGVGPGEIVAIIGPNGAGKSTLLKGLVGVLRVFGGTVRLGTDDVTNHRPEELAARGVGYVPQVGDIFEPLSVRENLEMGGYLLRAGQIRAASRRSARCSPRLLRCSGAAPTSCRGESGRCSRSRAS
jgi:ABC-type branched-subunit amino acid transport system ATPase component